MDFQTANSFLNGKPKKEGTNNKKNYEGLCHGKKPVFSAAFLIIRYSLFIIHSFSVSNMNALSNVPGY